MSIGLTPKTMLVWWSLECLQEPSGCLIRPLVAKGLTPGIGCTLLTASIFPILANNHRGRVVKIYILRMVATAFLLLGLAACGGSGGTAPPTDGEDTSNSGGDSGNAGNDTGGSAGSGGGNGSGGTSFGTPTASQIRPGVLITADGSQCTSNFVYGDAAGNYYIGAAAHCFSPDANSGKDPCETLSLAMGTAVTIENATYPGSLYYSSWPSMQSNLETLGSGTCTYNDFAVVKIDARDNANVHPAAIAFEGPTGLLRGNANLNDDVYSYGQSPSHFGVRSREEKEGTVSSQTAGGWQYGVSLDSPGLPGDSGSAVLHQSGKALGVLTVVSTCVGLGCAVVSNGVANLEMALDYANDYLSDQQSNQLQLQTWSNFTP